MLSPNGSRPRDAMRASAVSAARSHPLSQVGVAVKSELSGTGLRIRSSSRFAAASGNYSVLP